ncbi:MAG TPA: nucleotidyltransferase family protein [Gemmatimonadaceae bacterium]
MIVGLLLAAGGGRRFGSQKLLARLHGAPIVATAAGTLAPLVDRLIVVVGSEAQAVTDALAGIDVTLVENPRWADGLSTSLKLGVLAAPKETKAVVVTLGDQPGIDPALVRKVIARWRETGHPIVSTRYRGNRGHPVLLGCSVFGEVGAISGDAGARSLMERDTTRVAFVDVDADAPPDVDTPDDLAALES